MSTTAAPTFASKRRKTHQRAPLSSRSPSPDSAPVHLPPRPARRFGLTLSSKPAPTTSASSSSGAAATSTTSPEVSAVVNRFTHQTGQTVDDVDKHMMSYIEARMSSGRGTPAAAPAQEATTDQKAARSSYWAPAHPEARGATLGKLHEVDLGDEARERNIQLTQAALSGGATEKVAGRKDGKRRRTSGDVERDRLVEEVLKETRLDLYTEEPEEEGTEEGEADEKIAERFRKEFIDAIISKRRRKAPEVKGKKEEKKPRGPKLGGSRMARAQMREKEAAVGKK